MLNKFCTKRLYIIATILFATISNRTKKCMKSWMIIYKYKMNIITKTVVWIAHILIIMSKEIIIHSDEIWNIKTSQIFAIRKLPYK